jgi:hypothetical protein
MLYNTGHKQAADEDKKFYNIDTLLVLSKPFWHLIKNSQALGLQSLAKTSRGDLGTIL